MAKGSNNSSTIFALKGHGARSNLTKIKNYFAIIAAIDDGIIIIRSFVIIKIRIITGHIAIHYIRSPVTNHHSIFCIFKF